MNRPLKFRAWDITNRRFFDLAEVRVPELNCVKDDEDNDVVFIQCTCKKDKNGREVWEGDIIQHPSFGLAVITYHADYMRFQADAQEAGIAGFVISTNISRCEVIGNIYENPELLEVK